MVGWIFGKGSEVRVMGFECRRMKGGCDGVGERRRFTGAALCCVGAPLGPSGAQGVASRDTTQSITNNTNEVNFYYSFSMSQGHRYIHVLVLRQGTYGAAIEEDKQAFRLAAREYALSE